MTDGVFMSLVGQGDTMKKDLIYAMLASSNFFHPPIVQSLFFLQMLSTSLQKNGGRVEHWTFPCLYFEKTENL